MTVYRLVGRSLLGDANFQAWRACFSHPVIRSFKPYRMVELSCWIMHELKAGVHACQNLFELFNARTAQSTETLLLVMKAALKTCSSSSRACKPSCSCSRTRGAGRCSSCPGTIRAGAGWSPFCSRCVRWGFLSHL